MRFSASYSTVLHPRCFSFLHTLSFVMDLSRLLGHLRRFAGASARQLYYHVYLAWLLLRDPSVPVPVKTVLASALAYVGVPLDAVPDILPVAGFGDDLAVLVGALVVAALHIRPEMRAQAKAAVDAVFGPQAHSDWDANPSASSV